MLRRTIKTDLVGLREASGLCGGPDSALATRRGFFCTAAGAIATFAAPSIVGAQPAASGTSRLLASVPQARRLDFVVLRNGGEFGRHSVVFSERGDEIGVDIDIELKYALGPLTLFRYTHNNKEAWRGGKLVALDSVTDDDGTPHRVSYRANGDKATLDTGATPAVLPGNLIPTSYWNVDTVSQKRLLNTQTGEVLNVDVRETAAERITLRGAAVDARRFSMTGDLILDLWYADGVWVKSQFEARGHKMEYVLR